MTVLENREFFETLSINKLGYACRVFQEDCNIRPSWGYTVGLEVDGNPVCIFVRSPIDSGTIDYILSLACELVKDGGIPVLPCHLGEFTNQGKDKLRFKFRRQSSQFVNVVKDSFNNYIEGQKEGTLYYWLLLADDSNILPYEKEYKDFKQIETIPTVNIAESNEDLINRFDENDE